MKVFVFDVAKCVGCYNCQISCKDENAGNDWSPYSKPEPEIGVFYNHIEENVRGSVPKVKVAFVNIRCNHCDDAKCIQACPAKAIYKRESDGLNIIDPQKCTGCRACVDACPYGTISFNESLNIAQKCSGCAHLLDRGWPIKEPRCVDACPVQALRFGEAADFKDEIAKAEVLHPEFKTKPSVYYLNLPKRFIAGTVFDPAAMEVVVGATVTLSGDSTATTKTDGFGDFWLEGLKVGKYSVKITSGSKTKTFDAVSTDKDVNLGDIPLA
jgi:Fe-S-cluster-containing dehydrogenase component